MKRREPDQQSEKSQQAGRIKKRSFHSSHKEQMLHNYKNTKEKARNKQDRA